jgi:YVTN family beta-propeller protein
MDKTTMKKYVSLAGICSIFLAATLVASTSRILVTNSAGTEVHVIDPATNKVVQVIEGIEVPHGVASSPDGSRIYISNESESVLNVVDSKSGKTIKKVPLSGHPNNIAVTKDGGRVVVCIVEKPGALDIIDTAKLERTKSIPMKAPMHNPAITPEGKFAVAGSVVGKFIVVVDLQTEKPVWEVQFDKGVRPFTIESAADGSTSRIFAELSDLDGFAVVDFAKRAEVARIKNPTDAGAFPLPPQASPSHGIGVSPDRKTLWVNSSPSNSVVIYSLPDLKVLGHVPLPTINVAGTPPIATMPNWITFTPDNKTAYITNSGDRSVSAIDMKAMKQVARIPVGEVPKRINTMVLP